MSIEPLFTIIHSHPMAVYYTKLLLLEFLRVTTVVILKGISKMNTDDKNLDKDGLNEIHDGNLFFMHKHKTIDITKQIEVMNSFEEFDNYYTNELMDGNVLLQEYLSELLTRYDIKAEIVSLKIGYSHDYVRKIAMGERQNPRRDVLLGICTYIQATVEETQLLLRYAGQQPLYARRKRDAIIWFALQKKQNAMGEKKDISERIKKLDSDFEKLNEYLISKKCDPVWKG